LCGKDEASGFGTSGKLRSHEMKILGALNVFTERMPERK